jgi:hypothetical protein
MSSSSEQSSPLVTYTESDRIVWEEDLDSFVPARIFDAHSHLWIDDHLPSEHPRRNTMVQSTMRITEDWNKRIFPDRQMDYLVLGCRFPG